MELRKRVALSLNPELDGLLTDMAKLMGVTKTSIITNFLESAVPVFEQTVQALKSVQQGKQETAISAMSTLLSDGSELINDAQLELDGLGDANNGNK